MTLVHASKPLAGILVLDFSQFLSGPSAGLRLADLGARVVKIEREGIGDICRQLYISNQVIDGDSTLFHAINRNKESIATDLKNPEHLAIIKQFVRQADVLIANFRPGVMARMGLNYEQVRDINPSLIYGEITGYGDDGPWVDRPGQDLLIQACSGLTWLNGHNAQQPVPMGLAIADMMAGNQLVQGILACLVRRGIDGRGAQVHVSLLEATLDVQVEALSCYLNDGGKRPQRDEIHHAHAYQPAPYGIYPTQDGYIAIGRGSVVDLGRWLACEALLGYEDELSWMNERDAIKQQLATHLHSRPTEYWLALLEAANYPCADVYAWDRILHEDACQELQMMQRVTRHNGTELITTRCPIRIDGEIYTSSVAAPRLDEDHEKIFTEFMV